MYLVCAVIGVTTIPLILPACKWYMLVVCFVVGPILALPNCYGCGLTDWDMTSM